VSDFTERVLPVLQAAYRVVSEDPENPYVRIDALNAELGREPDDPATRRVFFDLINTGYFFDLHGEFQLSRPGWPHMTVLTEKAFQAVAGWPTGNEALYAMLLAVLDDRIDREEDPEERGKLEKLKDGIKAVGREGFMEIVKLGVEAGFRAAT
jgi:hypothetical protein